MADLIAIAAIVLIVGAAVWYVQKAKKRGVKCIGCPAGCSCGKDGSCGGCCH